MKVKLVISKDGKTKTYYCKDRSVAFLMALQEVEKRLKEGDRLITQRHEVLDNLEFYQWVTDSASIELWIIE